VPTVVVLLTTEMLLTSRMLCTIATPFASFLRSPHRELPANS
jgi:hypothetical protein